MQRMACVDDVDERELDSSRLRRGRHGWLRPLAVVIFWCGFYMATMPGVASAIELLSDDRFVRAFGEACIEDQGNLICDPYEDVTDAPSPAFSGFGASVSAGDGGFASQTSVATTSSLSGVGSASGFSDVGYGIGDSVYDVSFRLLAPTLIDLSGTLEAEDTLGFGFAESEVRLSSGAQILFEEIADPIATAVPFGFSQLLPPGDYRLYLQADGDVSMDGRFDFSLTATPAAPVPLLGLGGLLTLGLTLGSGAVISLRRQPLG